MARSAGRWMAMPSEGWRAVTGEFIIDHGEGMRAFGVGVKHRTEAQDVTTLGERGEELGAGARSAGRSTRTRRKAAGSELVAQIAAQLRMGPQFGRERWREAPGAGWRCRPRDGEP